MANEEEDNIIQPEVVYTLATNVNPSSLDASIQAFEKLKSLAEYFASSESFSKGFECKDKDNKTIIDEVTKLPKISTADITLCLIAGNGLGLDLAGSLLLGKKLNRQTYISIMRGKEIGIPTGFAMEKIHTITTSRGDISYTGVEVISAKLLQGNVSYLPLIKSFAPYYIYTDPITKDEVEYDKIMDDDDNLKPNYFVVYPGIKAEEIDKAKVAGKEFLFRTRHGEYSKAIFIRTYKDGRVVKHIQRFSTVDAERAGLLPTWDANGVLVTKGKDNWISNTPQMMNNRTISIGGRIIGADLINLYTEDEAQDITSK